MPEKVALSLFAVGIGVCLILFGWAEALSPWVTR
jgi:hypothetical protein